jgi:hypothetical protein
LYGPFAVQLNCRCPGQRPLLFGQYPQLDNGSQSSAGRTRSALRDLDGRRRIERAELVGITDRYSAHHAVVIDGVLTEPPQWG